MTPVELAYSSEKISSQLNAAIQDDAADFLAQPEKVLELCDAFGSPLNVVFPEQVARNIASFRAVYERNNISGSIFYCTKPNKSLAVKKRAAIEGVCADVSSAGALKEILRAGFSPQRIEATGPKNPEYLSLAIQLGVILSADSITELEQALEIRSVLKLQEKTRIFVRLAGFSARGLQFTKQDGTFGTPAKDIALVYEFLKKHSKDFDFLGFSYYVSGATDQQRIVSLQHSLQLTLEAHRQGLNPQGLNIGGGFHVQYAESKDEWNDYTDDIKRSVVEGGQQMTWNDSGLGYRKNGALLQGAPNYMDHYTGSFAASDFEKTIQSPLPELGNESAVSILADTMLDLHIEPGRSMLDQIGITIGKVNLVKESTLGETLVLLDMNRSNLHSTHQKLLTQPIIISRNKSKKKRAPNGVYYVGNLCVSYDIIQYNKTFPEYLPEAGDLVVFVNTGPYIMDFIESNTLHQKTARKVAITRAGDNFRFSLDEEYNPIEEKLQEKYRGDNR